MAGHLFMSKEMSVLTLQCGSTICRMEYGKMEVDQAQRFKDSLEYQCNSWINTYTRRKGVSLFIYMNVGGEVLLLVLVV
jgi:hypothetical protein